MRAPSSHSCNKDISKEASTEPMTNASHFDIVSTHMKLSCNLQVHFLRSSILAAAFTGESWHHRYIRCRFFDSGIRFWLKMLPARTEWYERVPHLLSLQCHANMSVSCFRGINRVSLKHDGYAFRDASRLSPK